MSFDALLYAHARPEVLAGLPADLPSLPFPGHLREEDPREREKRFKDVEEFRAMKSRWASLVRQHGASSSEAQEQWDAMKKDERFRFLDTSWLKHVDAFVTLGSPIDKFLVLWWLNYKHLLVPARWMDASQLELRRQRKIRFFNYSDEQDPVGHHLDVAATVPAVQEVFAIEEDKVYNRYAVPGVAHTSYWKDLSLFKRIVHLAIDGGKDGPEAPTVNWFDARTYQKGLTYAYYVIPYAVLALHFFSFTWAFYSNSWHGRTVASLLLFGTFLLGRRLIDLSLWWRQVLKTKKCEYTAEADATEGQKEKAATGFRWRLCLLCLLYLGLAGVSVGLLPKLAGWPELIQAPRLAFIGGVFGLSFIVWWLLFLDHQAAWRTSGASGDTSAPEMNINEGALTIEITTALLLAVAWGGGIWLVSEIQYLQKLLRVTIETLQSSPLLAGLGQRIADRQGEIGFNLASLLSMAALVFTYTCLRFYQIREKVRGKGMQQKADFVSYAGEPAAPPVAAEPREKPPVPPVTAPVPGV